MSVRSVFATQSTPRIVIRSTTNVSHYVIKKLVLFLEPSHHNMVRALYCDSTILRQVLTGTLTLTGYPNSDPIQYLKPYRNPNTNIYSNLKFVVI